MHSKPLLSICPCHSPKSKDLPNHGLQPQNYETVPFFSLYNVNFRYFVRVRESQHRHYVIFTLVGNANFVPTIHMTNREWKKKTFTCLQRTNILNDQYYFQLKAMLNLGKDPTRLPFSPRLYCSSRNQ